MESDRQLEGEPLFLRCVFDAEKLAGASQPVAESRDVQAHGVRASLAAAPGLQIFRKRLHIGRAALRVVPRHRADAAFNESLDLACVRGGKEKREAGRILRRQAPRRPKRLASAIILWQRSQAAG